MGERVAEHLAVLLLGGWTISSTNRRSASSLGSAKEPPIRALSATSANTTFILAAAAQAAQCSATFCRAISIRTSCCSAGVREDCSSNPKGGAPPLRAAGASASYRRISRTKPSSSSIAVRLL